MFTTIQLFSDRKINFFSHRYIHQTFSYFGVFIFAIIFNKINKCLLRSKNKTIENNSLNSSFNRTKSSKSLRVSLIHNDEFDLVNYNYRRFFLFLFVLITIFIFVIAEQILFLYGIALKDLDFWMFEIIILSYMNSRMFKTKIYKHQKLGLFLNFFSCFFKIGIIILSFANKKDDEEKPIVYIKFNIFLLGFVGLIIYLISIFLRSYAHTKFKWFMDLRFIDPTHVLMVYGIIGTLVCFFISLISTFQKCKTFDSNNNKIDFNDYICYVNKNITEKNKTELYFENLDFYFKKYSESNDGIEIFHEVSLLFLLMIIFFFYKYFYILVIKYLNPIFVIFSLPLYFFIQKIILILYNLIVHQQLFKKSDKYLISKLILDLSGDIISIIGFIIFLEIIELKFNIFYYNLTRNIIERSRSEINEMKKTFNKQTSLNSENDEEDDINPEELNIV